MWSHFNRVWKRCVRGTGSCIYSVKLPFNICVGAAAGHGHKLSSFLLVSASQCPGGLHLLHPSRQTGREEPKLQHLMREEGVCAYLKGVAEVTATCCKEEDERGEKEGMVLQTIILLCPSTRSTSFKAKWVFSVCVREIDSFWCVD